MALFRLFKHKLLLVFFLGGLFLGRLDPESNPDPLTQLNPDPQKFISLIIRLLCISVRFMTVFLKVLSSEMDLAESRLIR
jgi:hypothetical protein